MLPAEVLFNVYFDPISKLHMLFLRPILTELNRAIKSFQSDDNDQTKLLADLGTSIESTDTIIVVLTARVDLHSDLSLHFARSAH